MICPTCGSDDCNYTDPGVGVCEVEQRRKLAELVNTPTVFGDPPVTITLTAEQAEHVSSAIYAKLQDLGDPRPGYFTPERLAELRAEINALDYAYGKLTQ